MQTYPLPPRPQSPSSPTQPLAASTTRAEMAIQAPQPPPRAIQGPNTTRAKPSSTPSTCATVTQRSTPPLKTDSSEAIMPVVSQHDNTHSSRSSPEVQFISARSFVQATLDEATERMVQKLGDMEKEMSRATMEAAKFKKEQKELHEENKRLKAKVNSVQNDNERLVGEKLRLNQDYKAEKSRKAKLDEEVTSLRAKDAASNNGERRINDLKKQSEVQATKRGEQEASIHLLTIENKELKSKFELLETDKDTQTAKLTALEKQMEIATSDAKARDEQLDVLRTSNANLDTAVKGLKVSEECLRAGKKALANENHRVKIDLEQSKADLNTSLTALRERGAKINGLQEEINNLRQAEQSSRDRLQDLATKTAAIERQYVKDIQERDTKIEERDAKIACQQQKVDELEKQILDSATEFANLNDKITGRQKHIEEMRTDLESKDSKLGECQSEIKHLRTQLEACSGSLSVSKNECARLREAEEEATSLADREAAVIISLYEQMGILRARRNTAIRSVQDYQNMPTNSASDVSLPATDTTFAAATLEAISPEIRRVADEFYSRISSRRVQLRVDGQTVLRRDREGYIGLMEAEHILEVPDDEALIAPYRQISSQSLEILVDGRRLPRGFEEVPKSQEERHTLEEAGVSISEKGEEPGATRNAPLVLSCHGEPSWRDIALSKKTELESEVRRADEKAARRAEESIVTSTEQQAATPTDPRLRIRPVISIPPCVAPVAVMVQPSTSGTEQRASSSPQHASADVEPKRIASPSPQLVQPILPKQQQKQLVPPRPRSADHPLRRLSTDATSETESLQIPALTHDEDMSPKETGPSTPGRSPKTLQGAFVPNTLKRKSPPDLFEQSSRRPNSIPKRTRTTEIQDPLERAPRGPRAARDSRAAYHEDYREYDRYDRDRRDDGRSEPHPTWNSYRPNARRVSHPSPDYGDKSRR